MGRWFSLRSVFFRSLRTKADGSFAGKPCFALFCSWVLRSLVRIGERGERERGRGVWCFFGWLIECCGFLFARSSGGGFSPRCLSLVVHTPTAPRSRPPYRLLLLFKRKLTKVRVLVFCRGGSVVSAASLAMPSFWALSFMSVML